LAMPLHLLADVGGARLPLASHFHRGTSARCIRKQERRRGEPGAVPSGSAAKPSPAMVILLPALERHHRAASCSTNQISGQSARCAIRNRSNRVQSEVAVTLRRAGLSMAKDSTNDIERGIAGDGSRSKRVSKVVQPHAV